jgi:release factor glutamine methyltransferase
MLARHVAREAARPGTSVLDVCTGSGAIAVAAARGGADAVTAVDLSRRAVAAARVNAALNGVRVRALRGNLFAPVAGRRFHAIASNPPYLPAESEELPRSGLTRAWEAGRDGRVLLDRIIRSAREHLLPGGSLWLVHSSVCGTERTLSDLQGQGLYPQVVERRRGPIGPLLAARARDLEARGLLAPGEREEELVVVRAVAPREG